MPFPFHNKGRAGTHSPAAEGISDNSGVYFNIPEHDFEVRLLWSNSEAVTEEFDEYWEAIKKTGWRNNPLRPTPVVLSSK